MGDTTQKSVGETTAGILIDRRYRVFQRAPISRWTPLAYLKLSSNRGWLIESLWVSLHRERSAREFC